MTHPLYVEVLFPSEVATATIERVNQLMLMDLIEPRNDQDDTFVYIGGPARELEALEFLAQEARG